MKSKESKRPRGRLASWGAIALAAVAVALLVPSAAQAAKTVTGGKSTLKLNKRTAEGLADSGVRLRTIKPARSGAEGITFPIVGGELKTRNSVTGTLKHSGGLKFSMNGMRVKAKSFVVDLERRSKLTARIGGDRIALLKLDTDNAEADVGKRVVTVSGLKSSLTSSGAKALNEGLDTDLFRKGVKFGKLGSKARIESGGGGGGGEGRTVALDGGDTRLKVDPDAAQALSDLGIEAAPIAPATATPNGKIAFPIRSGKLNPRKLEGTVRHRGGLELTDGSATVALKRFKIELAERRILSAKVGEDRLPILKLDVGDAKSRQTRDTLNVAPIEGALTGKAANALNEAFETSAFERGLVLGSLAVKGEIKG